jgi:hypothetical protein
LQKPIKSNKIRPKTLIYNYNNINNVESNLDIILENRPINPVSNWTYYTENLINKYISSTKNDFIYIRGKAISNYSQTNKNFKYKVIYKPSSFLYTNKEELALGYGNKKIILFVMSTNLDYFVDYTGQLGVGPNTLYLTFNTLKERMIIHHYIRSIFIKTGDGEELLINGGPNNTRSELVNLLSHVKLLEINPYHFNRLTDNPYKTLPANFVMYRSCYPIKLGNFNNV